MTNPPGSSASAPPVKGKGATVGRPSKFTPDRIAIILEHVGRGVPKVWACKAAGVSEATFYKWISWAEKEGEKGGRFSEFVEALAQAEAGFMAIRVAGVAKLANGWEEETTETRTNSSGGVSTTVKVVGKRSESAAKWMLERRFPADFGPRQTVEHAGELTVKRILVPGLPAAESAE